MVRTENDIEVDVADGATVVRLCGEVDAALRERASAVLARIRAEGRPVVVDACGTSFVDSTGVAFLVRCAHACAEAGLPLTLRDAPEQLAGVLDVLGLAPLFPRACPG